MPTQTYTPADGLSDRAIVHLVRHVHDRSLAEIAERTGYSERMVSHWLAGTQRMRAGTRAVLTQMLAEARATLEAMLAEAHG